MARSRRCSSPDDDGYKRFTEDIHNVSYGSNSTSKFKISNLYRRRFKILRNVFHFTVFSQKSMFYQKQT